MMKSDPGSWPQGWRFAGRLWGFPGTEPVAAAASGPATIIAPILIGLTALAAYLYRLGARGLWVDEVFSLRLVRLPWREMLGIMAQDEANQTLFYLLLRGWLVFGESPVALRSLSVLFASGAAVLTYFLGRKMFSPYVGILASLLFITNGVILHQAQDARGYAMVLFLVCAASLVWLYCLERPRSLRLWGLYALLSIAAVYTHFFGALVIGSHLIVVFCRREELALKTLAATFGLIVLASLPLAFFVIFRGGSQTDWVPPPTLSSLFVFIFHVSGGSRRSMYVQLFLLVIGFTLLVTRWVKRRQDLITRHWITVAAWFLLSVMLAFLGSFIKPVFITKYLVVVIPAYALMLAATIGGLRHGWLRYLCLFILVPLNFDGMSRAYLMPPHEDWEPTARQVLTAARSGDCLIVFCPFTKLAFDHYAALVEGGQQLIYVPYFKPAQTVHPLYGVPAGYSMGGAQPPVDPSLFARLEAHHPEQIWLVLSHDHFGRIGRSALSAELQELLGRHYVLKIHYRYHNVKILRYARPPTINPTP